ncbi:MAG: hypothetical protein KJO69_09650 [Gammaproteobacteria bacterium]|nr:hypothetical protein [Gammaproteobacteria bacterium]
MMRVLKQSLLILLTALVMFASPLFMDAVKAVEITPIEQVDPERLQDELDNLGARNELAQQSNTVLSKSTKKSKPSVWAWLTNQSRKPANFHFIDIIEILD